MRGKAYNIVAAVLCTLAGVLATAAVIDTAPTDARNFGIAAGVVAVLSGLAWIVAAVKG